MSAVRKERLSIGKVAALGGAAIAVLAAAVTGDVVGYSASSQILLVVVASFGGAVFGSFIISQRKRHAPRQNALVVMRGPTAAELHEMVGIGC